MLSPFDIAWLIPLLPLVGAIFIGILLISFNRTMNRLSKPVAFVLITCSSISAIISYWLFANEFSHELTKDISIVFNLFFTENNFQIHFVIDKIVSIILSIVSTLIIASMILYHLLMYRKERYVLFFILISLASSTLLGLSLTELVRTTANGFIA